MTAWEILCGIAQCLELNGIAYMLTGSLASAHYGVPRSTVDIDIVIAGTPDQLRSFVSSLPADKYYADLDTALEAQRRESMFNVIDLVSGWKIDLIMRKSRTFSREEFGRRQPIRLQSVSLFVATAEDVVLAKLEWSKSSQSQRQIDDVAAILKLRWETLDKRYLRKWISTLLLEREWTSAKNAAGLQDAC